MRLHVFRISAFALSVLTGGCAIPAHVALPPAAKEQMSRTEIVVPIRQHEIYVFVPQTQNPNGGLIGALVASVVDDIRSGKAETAVQPLRAALVDFDFDAAMKSALQTAIVKDAFMGRGETRITKELTADALEGTVRNSSAPAVLLAAADYRLSNDADVLDVILTTRLYANNDALRAMLAKPAAKDILSLDNTLYRNSLAFQTRIPTEPGGRDAHISTWSANNGEKARTALKLAATKLADMLARDLNWSAEEGVSAAKAGMPIKFPVEGQIIATDTDGALVRTQDGILEYVTSAAMLEK